MCFQAKVLCQAKNNLLRKNEQTCDVCVCVCVFGLQLAMVAFPWGRSCA